MLFCNLSAFANHSIHFVNGCVDKREFTTQVRSVMAVKISCSTFDLKGHVFFRKANRTTSKPVYKHNLAPEGKSLAALKIKI